jgi:hypothetical protein
MRTQRQRNRRWRPLTIVALVCLTVALSVSLGVKSSGASFISRSSNPGSRFSAGVVTLTNSKGGTAVINAAGLLPGGSTTGSLTITVQGNFSAAVTLTGTGDQSALSQVLTLKIENTTGTAQTLWSGKMSDFASLSLGTYTTGTTKSYRFTVTFPAANASSGLQNATTSMTLNFTGVAQ